MSYSENEIQEILQQAKELDAFHLARLRWRLQRRPKQTPPDPLPFIWFLRGGRSAGKTMTGSNHVLEYCTKLPHVAKNRLVRVALVSETLGDVKKTMLEGPTGLRAYVPKSAEIKYNRSMGEYSFTIPGPRYREVHCQAFSSETPDALRGPAYHLIWFDEPAKSKDSDVDPEIEGTCWSNMMFGLREGTSPHCIVTGTPTPCKLIQYLDNHSDCVTHQMSSLENEYVPQSQKDMISRLNPGSRVYRQEVLAEILMDNPDSQFDPNIIEETRKGLPDVEVNPYTNEEVPLPHIKILGWDPSMSSNPDADECGIVLSAKTMEHLHVERPRDTRIQAYVLNDYSGHMTPAAQANLIIQLIFEQRVEELVFEQNQGADFVMTLLQTALQSYWEMEGLEFKVRGMKKKNSRIGPIQRWRIITPIHTFIVNGIHAKAAKVTRAESVSLRYETKDVHHAFTGLSVLEDQMVAWNPTSKKHSPDRMDALVYTLLHIFGFEHALSTTARAKLSKPPDTNVGTGTNPLLQVQLPQKISRHAALYNQDMSGRKRSDKLTEEQILNDILRTRNSHFSGV